MTLLQQVMVWPWVWNLETVPIPVWPMTMIPRFYPYPWYSLSSHPASAKPILVSSISCCLSIPSLPSVVYLLDCPLSGPGPVWQLFADPRPGPGPILDLDPRSGPGLVWVWTWTPVLQCNYFLYKLFVINIHIYIIIQKIIFLIYALPNSLRPNFQLIFRNYESVDLLTFILPSKWARNY